MMANKRYGIIGCGMMGTEHINNIALLDGAEVASVYDPVESLAKAAAALANGATVAPTLDALIADESLDAYVIVSPNYLHIDQLEAILSNRSVPILCEKPLYSDQADRERITAIEAAHSDKIWVAMEYRYMPAITAMIEESASVVGDTKMLTIREHRFPFLEKIGDWNRFNRFTGGTLVEKCCHFFDLMRLMLQSDPVRVSASAGQMTNHLDERYDGETPDIWDGGYVIFDFASGARAMLDLCMFAEGSPWQEEISAVGPEGKIECRVPGPTRFWPDHLGAQPHSQLSRYPRTPMNPQTRDIHVDEALLSAGDHHGSTFFQHQQFLEVVKGNRTPEVTLRDGRMAVIMGLAAQTAAVEKRVVEISEFT